MEVSFHEMELLSRSLSNAHRSAVQAELNAAGLEKVGHPMLVSILQSADEDPEGQFQAQRELADLLHVSPPAIANSLKCLERDTGPPRALAQGRPAQPGDSHRKGDRSRGGLPGRIPPGVRPDDGRFYPRGAGPAGSVSAPDAGQSDPSGFPRKGVILPCFPCS